MQVFGLVRQQVIIDLSVGHNEVRQSHIWYQKLMTFSQVLVCRRGQDASQRFQFLEFGLGQSLTEELRYRANDLNSNGLMTSYFANVRVVRRISSYRLPENDTVVD